MSMCVGTCVCVQISKYFCLHTHKRMAGLTLNLKAVIHAGKCAGSHGYEDEGKLENEKKRDGALWTRIVCVKVFGPSVARRDR